MVRFISTLINYQLWDGVNMGFIGNSFFPTECIPSYSCLHLSSYFKGDTWKENKTLICICQIVNNFFRKPFPVSSHSPPSYGFSSLSKITNFVLGRPGFKKKKLDEISPQKFHTFLNCLSPWTYIIGRFQSCFISPSSILSQVIPQPQRVVF